MFDERRRKDIDLVKKTETTIIKRKCREDCASSCSVAKTLSKETIALYFNMPITLAAKELKIGLTLLKKRCRELSIQRWPHRKLKSLQELTNSIKV